MPFEQDLERGDEMDITPIDRDQFTPFEEELYNHQVSNDVQRAAKHYELLNALVRHIGKLS